MENLARTRLRHGKVKGHGLPKNSPSARTCEGAGLAEKLDFGTEK
jgi:hypothetical protein